MSALPEMSEKRRRLLDKLLAAEGLANAGDEIARRPDGEDLPLSFGQERLWFLHHLAPARATYHVTRAIRLDGALAPGALDAAWRRLVDRHEELRAELPAVDGRPVRRAVAGDARRLPVVDLSGLDEARREDAARRVAADRAARPFRLDRGPLWRTLLVRLAPQHHVFCLVLHHVIADGWSLRVLFGELARLHAAGAGEGAELPPLPIRYADFAAWQRERWAGEALERELAAWRERLAGASTALELPVDRPWPSEPDSRGGSVPLALGGRQTARLRGFAREHRATLFQAVLAALGVLLSSLTGRDDLLVGVPAANRRRPETAGLVGFLVDNLVVRLDLGSDPTAAEAVARARQAVLWAEDHQDLPFEKLVTGLEVPRDLARSPLFQVMLTFQNLPAAEAAGDGLRYEPFALPGREALFELHFTLGEEDGRLVGALDFRRGLFDATTALRIARRFERILDDLPRRPDEPLSRRGHLSAAERQQVVLEWNDTAAPLAEHPRLHRLIEEQVRRTPEAPAVVDAAGPASYREVDARADALARRLRAIGCGGESRVAVAMERSTELVVALLAVLKAGAAYVPLDPEYPAERLAGMLADVRPAALVTEEAVRAALPDDPGVPVVVLPRGGREEAGAAVADQPASGAALAYVIYTSGSTGRPKGAMVHHRGIVNRLLWMQEAYRLTADDAVLQKTPFSFDVSVWELFLPLMTGARLVVAEPGGHRDPRYLARLIHDQRITVMHFVPSMLQVFLEEVEPEACRSLRLVVCSGEALARDLVDRFHARLGRHGTALENLYGPTEASVDVTRWSCPAGSARRAVPIGRPIANTRIHLVDRRGDPVPPGVAGELLIGGANVGRGYWARPALTAERFVPDPWGAPGERSYRTGDLARWGTSGEIDFLGRIDHQVKVRGVRIELGEIEAVLADHPAVREAVVIARGGGDQVRLAAYAVAASRPAPAAEELRLHLRERLPEAMVPADLVLLDSLPLLPNGKLDRAALPAPGPRQTGRIPPRTPLERVLAGIWEQELGVERVGVEDDYFALGGDSLRAVRLVARIVETLSRDLRVQDVFRFPTVAAMAAHLAAAGERPAATLLRDAGRAELGALRQALLADADQRGRLPEGWQDVYPLSGIENGMVFYSLLLPEEPVYVDQYVYLLEIDDVRRFFDVFDRLVARHPVLRSGFHAGDFAEPMKVVHAAGRVARRVEDLGSLPRQAQRRRVDRYRREELGRPFRFRGEPLWRLKLFRLAGPLHAVVWTYYHGALDGWSNHVLWVEANELYDHSTRGEQPPPPPLRTDYRDYVALQRVRRRDPEATRFWRQLLAGAARNRLPYRRTRRETVEEGMGRASRQLPGDLLAELRRRAADAGVPLQVLCLTAHFYLLHALSGEDDVVTGLVTHDRPPLPDAERLLGCFLNTVPLRLRVEPGDSGLSLLAKVVALLREEKARELLLSEIAEELGVRDGGENPFFDTLFNFMDFHVMAGAGRNVLFRPMESREQTALLDLRAEEMTNTHFDLEVSTTLDHFQAWIKYSRKHFRHQDAERALELYAALLGRLATDPAAPLGVEALLSAADRRLFVEEFNATRAPFPETLPLHGGFERRAAEDGRQPAVSSGGRQLTYGELEERANRLARYLIARGVRRRNHVGVVFERSVELAVALLAVLKAGAAYVPLEPDHPPARKGYVLASSRAVLAIGDRRYPVEGEGADVPFLVPGDGDLAPLAATPPGVASDPDDLAYVIYTSGSTGTPKGVMIEHRSAANLVHWVNRTFALGPGSRLLMLSSVCFDLSVYDLFGGLAAGAAVVVPRHEDLEDPARLARMVRAEGITFWSSVPSTMGHLVGHLEQEEPDFRHPELAVVFLSGDWIPVGLPDRIRRFFPAARVISLGGATEAAVWSNSYPIERVDPEWTSIPYGRPIDNNAFYVLDRRLDLVPPGVVGDLYIGGDGVARGYAAAPRKTAAAFVPDRFADRPGARLYRTGDLARMLPDANLEFLGRVDNQVKIRGFRVELGEIESHLGRHPAVRQAVVMDRRDGAGEKYLCAYVVAGDRPVEADALRRHLAEFLPDYMIPAAFLVLDALPLTANGKIDRRALPEPGGDRLASAQPHLGPASAAEAELLSIWREVLGVERVGTRDDFFQLGGHSLSAVQAVSRIRRRFGVELPLRRFFEEPTVARLAAVLEAEEIGGGRPPSPAIRALGRERGPLSYSQQRLWFMDQLEPGSPFYNIFSAVRLAGSLRAPLLRRALAEIVVRHEVLRTVFVERPDGVEQVVGAPFAVELPVVDLTALEPSRREARVRALVAAESAAGFDLAGGRLLRCRLLRVGAEEHVMVVCLHHIVSDGWSSGVLVRELVTLYRALGRGRTPDLAELPVQYLDFAVWQREWLQGEVLAGEVEYWRRQLAAAPAVIRLATDRPRPPVQSFRGDQRPVRFSPELSERLRGFSRDEGATLFMTLLGLFEVLLHVQSGERDVVVGAPISYRNWTEIEGMIGFFVNTLVYRVDLSGDPTFREVLARVRRVVLEAFAHQHLPFDKLVEELRPERDPSHQPIFQVGFTLQPPAGDSVMVEDLEVSVFEYEVTTTQFDLNLSLTDTPRGIGGRLEYSRDLFDDLTIEWMAERLGQLAERVEAAPETRLSELRELAAASDRERWRAVERELTETTRDSFRRRRRRSVGPNPPVALATGGETYGTEME